MTIEKPQPLYDKKGLVNDPEIAREMADQENQIRNTPGETKRIKGSLNKKTDQEAIDTVTDSLGQTIQSSKERAYENEVQASVAEKIKNILSDEEIKILRQNPKQIIDAIKE